MLSNINNLSFKISCFGGAIFLKGAV